MEAKRQRVADLLDVRELGHGQDHGHHAEGGHPEQHEGATARKLSVCPS